MGAGAGLVSLLAIVGLARAVQRRWPQPRRTDHLDRYDALLVVILGVAAALCGGVWLAPFTTPGTRAVGSPDFAEYCWHTTLFLTDALHEWGENRSMVAGLLPGLLARKLGVLDGLLTASLLSLGGIGGGVYLWARALHSRSAGVAAGLLVAAVGPLALLGRTLTFYPEITAATVFASAGAAAALRWRTPLTVALAGIGAGLALLIDARGLLWALPAAGLGLWAAGLGPPEQRWPQRLRGLPLRLLALSLPLWLSYQWGSWAYPSDARPLEGHVAVYDELRSRGVPLPAYTHPTGRNTAFVWGRTDLRELPWTLRYVQHQGTYVPDWYRDRPEVVAGWARSGKPWLWPALFALVVGAVGLRRRPWLLAGLAGTSLAFVLAFEGAVVLKTSNLRFVGSAMPFLPVWLGVGLGVLVEGALPAAGQPTQRGGWAAAVLGIGLLLSVLGVVPSILSPTAAWRVPWPTAEGALRTALEVRSGMKQTPDSGMRVCGHGLKQVPGDGLWLGSLPGGGSEVQPWTPR